MDHRAEHEMVPPEQHGGTHHVSGLEALADRGRGHGGEVALCVGHDLIDHCDREAVAHSRIRQEGGRAAPLPAEMEIVADHRRGDAEPPHQDLGDEGLCVECGEAGVERLDDHAVDGTEPGEGQRLGGDRRQPKDRRGPGEVVGRMRFEGQDRAGPADFLSQGVGTGNDRLMTAMHAIEVADRHDRAFKADRLALRIFGDDEAGRKQRGQTGIRDDELRGF